jgi:hypothetical protein
VLDFLHVAEKLWKVAHALYREGSREAETFVYERAERILNGQVGQVVKGLKLIVTAVGQVDVVAHPVADRLDLAAHPRTLPANRAGAPRDARTEVLSPMLTHFDAGRRCPARRPLPKQQLVLK